MVCEGNAVSPVDAQRTVACKYARAGQIVARTANGVRQTYEYDKKGQLLAVKDDAGNAVESYAYDKAGNMLKKTVNGKTTTFTFDDANQLVSSTTDGVTTRYAYDAAGRMVREGSKTYRYGYLDKVMSVTDGDTTRTFTYHADGQLASASLVGTGASPVRNEPETFQWDGLALIQRGDEQFINEPHVGGGNPVASSKGTSYFNDVLGTTVGSKSNGKYSAAALTAFGEGTDADKAFFTGKPMVEGLGHAFLMRNYRAGLAKWQSADPMGYPDGWNQLAYCNNGVTSAVDLWGCFDLWPFGGDDPAVEDDPVVSTVIEFITGDEQPIENSLLPLGREVHCGDKPCTATIKLGKPYTADFKISLTKALNVVAQKFGIDLSQFLNFEFEYKIQNTEIQYTVPGYKCLAKNHNQHGDDQGEEIVVPYFQALASVKVEVHKSGKKTVSDAEVYGLVVRTKCIALTDCKE